MKTLTALITLSLVIGFTVNGIAFDKNRNYATAAAYIDIATGHRYLKNPDNTYMEFTKKGTLFRESIPNNMPLLTINKNIRQMEYTSAKPDDVKKALGLGYSNTSSSIRFDDLKPIATGAAYFDTATGHKYVKNPDGTYAEFTKKGTLFRNFVPNHMALLTTNKNIRDLEESCYLLYKRMINRKPEIMVLPSTQKHPTGWKCMEMLITMN